MAARSCVRFGLPEVGDSPIQWELNELGRCVQYLQRGWDDHNLRFAAVLCQIPFVRLFGRLMLRLRPGQFHTVAAFDFDLGQKVLTAISVENELRLEDLGVS